MKTRLVKGDKLTTEHIILGIKTKLGMARFDKPLKVWELTGKRESAFDGFNRYRQTYHVGPMEGDTSKQFLARMQFSGYSDTEYQVLELY